MRSEGLAKGQGAPELSAVHMRLDMECGACAVVAPLAPLVPCDSTCQEFSNLQIAIQPRLKLYMFRRARHSAQFRVRASSSVNCPFITE